MGPEALFKRWFLFKLPKGWHAQTIETTTGRGVPDLNVCHEGREYWIELKADGAIPKIRPEQWAWMTRRMNCLGRCLILNRHQKKWWLWAMHSPNSSINYEVSGGYVRVISPSDFSGESHESLLQAIKAL